jgi:DNA-binding GntR family transcriptional regulator
MSAVLGYPYASTVTVDPDSATPLYIQVASLLRARIESGELTSRLPSLRTITQEYGVSHITAEKAVQSLREAGLVVTVVGRGTFVARD